MHAALWRRFVHITQRHSSRQARKEGEQSLTALIETRGHTVLSGAAKDLASGRGGGGNADGISGLHGHD